LLKYDERNSATKNGILHRQRRSKKRQNFRFEVSVLCGNNYLGLVTSLTRPHTQCKQLRSSGVGWCQSVITVGRQKQADGFHDQQAHQIRPSSGGPPFAVSEALKLLAATTVGRTYRIELPPAIKNNA